ncbi:MAG: radical SAM protein [Polyangia bacterium]
MNENPKHYGHSAPAARGEIALDERLAYRLVEDTTVLVDTTGRRLLRLNAGGGRVLERIDRGEALESPADLAFARRLVELGLAREADRGRKESRSAASSSDPGGDALLDRLNRWASRRLVPLHAQMEITHRCGLRCRHCYLEGLERSGARELSLDERVGFLDELAGLGGLFLLITGGEPFVHPELGALFDAARERRFAVSLLTSGDAFDPGLASHMAARGLDAVQISIYGARAETHDALTRVAGSFERALEALRAFRELGVRTRAGLTVTSENAGELDEMLDLVGREGGGAVPNLYIEPRRDGSRVSQSLAADEETVRETLARLALGDEPRMRGLGPDDPPCGAGRNSLAVDPYGEITPCLSLRYPVGSIRGSSLGGIWRDSPRLAELRQIRLRDLEACPECEHRSFCDRCAGFAAAEGRPLTGHAEFDCLQARLRSELARGAERDRFS